MGLDAVVAELEHHVALNGQEALALHLHGVTAGVYGPVVHDAFAAFSRRQHSAVQPHQRIGGLNHQTEHGSGGRGRIFAGEDEEEGDHGGHNSAHADSTSPRRL